MKILGLDIHRTQRDSGSLKVFELEKVPNSDWIRIFESLFIDEMSKAWVEGYTIVTHCPTNEISTRLIQLREKCEEANHLLKSKIS